MISTRLTLTLALLATACSSPAAPSSRPLDGRIETASFVFHFASNDTVHADWQEAYHAWATATLGITFPQKIEYFKYQSRQHMEEVTGVGNTNGWAHPSRAEIHTIWPRDGHEVVHIYTSVWGMPVALWTEGLAVAYGQVDPVAGQYVPRWSGVPLHDRARQFLAQGQLVPIADLLTSSGFRKLDPNVTYPQSGSFVVFVIETCGLDGVERLYRAGNSDGTAASVRADFLAACGRAIEDVERDWHGMLTR